MENPRSRIVSSKADRSIISCQFSSVNDISFDRIVPVECVTTCALNDVEGMLNKTNVK
jgi:hypothetical protein